ncbi:Phosphoglucosamine mutase [hydrothermal vent metagenome]|uniref:Phosphoglucosamine mutase n=1 Tax=hydrothermal vent metagenome TaxID=652676 RepID=A0A1W1DLN3_9ZZZZ
MLWINSHKTCLVLRFEADNQQVLEEIQTKFRTWLENNDISTKDF